MTTKQHPQAKDIPSSAMALAGQVTARRISNVISSENGSRIVYAIVDLGSDLTSAIGLAVAELSRENARIEVAIHPDLATSAVGKELQTDQVATRFRNHKDDGVVATIFSVPGEQMEGVHQSLGTVRRINEQWLCDPSKAKLWASETLPNYAQDMRQRLEGVLQGLMDSGILTSAHMLATFCADVQWQMTGPRSLELGSAVNEALPALRLPRKCPPQMNDTTLAAKAAVQFRRWRDEFQPHLYLESKDGGLQSRHELLGRLAQLTETGDLKADAAKALEDLVNDRTITVGVWRKTQQRVTEFEWAEVRPFFRERARKPTMTLGEETSKLLDDEFPNDLSDQDRDILEEVRRETEDSSPEHVDLFFRYKEHISTNPKLYKRWERFVFNKPVEEDDDLLRGLIRLAERACQKADDIKRPSASSAPSGRPQDVVLDQG